MRIVVSTVALAATICFTATPAGATSKQKEIHKQLVRYYHADGYIKSIGKVAYRTIYSSNDRIRHKWKRAVHWLIGVRKDAAARLDYLRRPPPRPSYTTRGTMPGVDACLDKLIRREGGYNPHAVNPYSGAYGAPQALPGSKMASAGPDWRDNLATQIRWMWGYVKSTYGGSCNALSHSYAYGWY